jgi:hypothetical protein
LWIHQRCYLVGAPGVLLLTVGSELEDVCDLQCEAQCHKVPVFSLSPAVWLQALQHALATVEQRAADIIEHSSGPLPTKIQALMQAIDGACGLLRGRKYKTELALDVLKEVPAVLAHHQVGLTWGTAANACLHRVCCTQ